MPMQTLDSIVERGARTYPDTVALIDGDLSWTWSITDPAWTPLFVSAGAVVVEIGAPMSHAMIVSRELGVPCVTGIQNAAQRIKDGMLLEVNGGTVTILSDD